MQQNKNIFSELKFPLCKVQTGFYETKYACPEHSVTVHTQDDSYQSHQSDLDQSKTKDTSFSTSNNHGSMNKRLFWSILNFLHQHFSLKSIQFWYYKFFVWKHFWLSIYLLRFLSFFNIDFILPYTWYLIAKIKK